jgi:hypothetical protein
MAQLCVVQVVHIDDECDLSQDSVQYYQHALEGLWITGLWHA